MISVVSVITNLCMNKTNCVVHSNIVPCSMLDTATDGIENPEELLNRVYIHSECERIS